MTVRFHKLPINNPYNLYNLEAKSAFLRKYSSSYSQEIYRTLPSLLFTQEGFACQKTCIAGQACSTFHNHVEQASLFCKKASSRKGGDFSC